MTGYHTRWVHLPEHADDPERIAIREALAFGKAVYDQRCALGLSAADLAARADMTVDDVECIEEGGTEPTIAWVLRQHSCGAPTSAIVFRCRVTCTTSAHAEMSASPMYISIRRLEWLNGYSQLSRRDRILAVVIAQPFTVLERSLLHTPDASGGPGLCSAGQ
jgi:O-glycosyl hydrolase